MRADRYTREGAWEVPVRRRRAFWSRLSPPQLLVASFLTLIVAGTLGFKLLPGLYTGEELGWLDALFTATSAVCVTGLIVVDTATYFTPAGQAFILLLIQLGGLGIITLTSLVIVALGRRLSLRHEALAAGGAALAPAIDHRRLVRDIVLFTFAAEALGAVILWIAWTPRFGLAGGFWPALFHAISAFCNAGFSVFSDSLVGFQRSPLTLAAVMALIVVGGLGFLTLEELRLWWSARRRGRRYRVSLHSRLALLTSAALLVLGFGVIAALEWGVTLDGLPAWSKVLNAAFASVTPRTAGFNTIDYTETAPGTNFFTMMLMFVGGSPGSTAGGIKTTAAALVALLAWSRFRGVEVVSFGGRSVPEETVQRAVGLAVMAFGFTTLCILLYSVAELPSLDVTGAEYNFLTYVFEAVSAFNTVGLSMGVTADLAPFAEWLTIVLMFIGRVGPLAFAAAITLPAPSTAGEFRFAYEDVIVG